MTLEERFWSKVDKNGPIPQHCPELGPCWVWTAARLKSGGYGAFRIGRRTKRAHRVAWKIATGRDPGETCVLHRCDNPACVRFAHLFDGTRKDNSDDKLAKGREAKGDTSGARLHPERLPRGDRNGMRLHPECVLRGNAHYARSRPELLARGERHGAAKMTETLVREIRRRVSVEGESTVAVAASLGLHQSNVSRIARRLAWSHVV